MKIEENLFREKRTVDLRRVGDQEVTGSDHRPVGTRRGGFSLIIQKPCRERLLPLVNQYRSFRGPNGIIENNSNLPFFLFSTVVLAMDGYSSGSVAGSGWGLRASMELTAT